MAQSKKSKTNQGATSPEGKAPVTSTTAVRADQPAEPRETSAPSPVNSFRLRNNTSQKLVVSVHITKTQTKSISLLPKETQTVKGTYADKYVRQSLAIYGDQLSLVE